MNQTGDQMAAATSSPQRLGDTSTRSRTFAARSSVDGADTFDSRFDDVPDSDPEQLIAAAHASCYSIVLSNILSRAGRLDHSLQTEATVTLRPVDRAPTITKIALVRVGRVPGLDELVFADHALAAKFECSVSRALAGVPEITLEASLVQS
jgi:lipoyl-dependent peroxiredoxin